MKRLKIVLFLVRKRMLSFRPVKVLYDASVGFYEDDGFTFSAAIAFYFLLSFLPFLMLLGALVGKSVSFIQTFYRISQHDIVRHISLFIRQAIPYLKEEHIENILVLQNHTVSLGVVGFFTLLVSATLLFSTLHYSLFRIFGGKYMNIVLSRTLGILVMLVLTLLSFSLHLFLTFFSMLFKTIGEMIPVLYRWMTVIDSANIISLILSLMVLFALFYLLLYFFTSGVTHNKKMVFAGAFTFAVLWIAAKRVYDFYLNEIGSINLIYGSFAYIVSIVLWIYYSSMLLLFSMEMIKSLTKNSKKQSTLRDESQAR